MNLNEISFRPRPEAVNKILEYAAEKAGAGSFTLN